MADSTEHLAYHRPSITITDRDPLPPTLQCPQPFQQHPSLQLQPSSRASSPTPSHVHHARSGSQPQDLCHEPYLLQQYQVVDFGDTGLTAPIHSASPSHLQRLQPTQQIQPQQEKQIHYPHTFVMTKFLNFAVLAASLVEKLHQNGLIHGQLSPTSFRWEESSSHRTSDNNSSGNSNINVCKSTNVNTHTQACTSSSSCSPSSISTSAYKSDSDSPTNPQRHSYQHHPVRKENQTSPSQLTLDKSGSIAKTSTALSNGNASPCTCSNNSSGSVNVNGSSCSTNNGTSASNGVPRLRRYSLVLDCAHLGLGERSTEPADSPVRKGLRDHAPPSNGLGHGSSASIPSTDSSSTAPGTPDPNLCCRNTIGSLLDPALFPLSDPNLQPYPSNATVIHEVTSRMARFKRSFMHSSTSSPTSSNAATNPTAPTVPTSQALTTVGTPGPPQPMVVKQHFLLHVPQELTVGQVPGVAAPESESVAFIVRVRYALRTSEGKLLQAIAGTTTELHAPPGYVLPVQIDIYSLGVMLYYLWASYTSFRPEDLTPGAVKDALDAYASGCGSTFEKRTSCLSTTSTKLANIVQRMVAKNTKDRFLSMTQVRKELGILRDQEQEAAKKEKEKETDLKASLRGASENKIGTNPAAARSAQTLSTTPSSHSSAMARPASPANSTHSLQSTSTLASQDLDGSSSVTKQSVSSTHATIDDLSFEDRAFVLESILSLSHISNLQELLRAISHALDSILVGHPPEEMAIILWQKEDHLPGGGTWAIMEDKFQPGTSQSTLTWTDLSERRDHMPVLVHKALDSQEPIFSTAIGSRSQLPTIACVPIIASQGGESTLVGAIYLHHLHPRFYFTKRDQDMLILFCQKLAAPLLHSDKVTGLEKQLSLATQRNRFLEDTIAMIQKNEHEVFSWMEALPCFVWAAERDDVLSRRYLSRSWFDFTGLPADTRTGDRWISAMHPDDVAAFQKEVSQSYKTGTYKDCEFRLMRYDGVYRWHLSRAIPVLDHNGAVLKWVGVTIDIDDLYLAQKAELRKKSNFLANMSHELRTPFSGFHGMLSLLGYSDLNEEQQECVFTAKASCEKLLLIIDDLLDFSKLEADKVTLEASPFDLQEVFDEVEDIVEPLASQSSLELGFIKAENVPEVLIGDSNRLKQILLNLVGNAIKFTHSGHVMVRCEVLRRDSDMAANSAGSLSTSQAMDDDKFYFKHEKNGGGQCQSEVRPPNSGRFSSPEPLSQNSIKLMFSVEDTGIGISPEEQEILFSPFSQVDGSATRSYGGSGLGLSICLQLVKLMKGRIGLRSEREKGSTFWFTVQCEQPPTVESPVRPVQEAEVGESTREIKRITRTLGTPRILIASTSGPTITTLLSFLSDFNTEVVNTPLQAASRLEESVANGIRFDFVCWDFPKYDPNHTMMLELQARPNLNNVHFVLLYTANPDTIRRAQSLQLPSSSSPTNPLSSGRKRPHLSQSASLRIEHTGIGGHGSCSSTSSEVPGLSPEKINSLRITCISKPIRRLKLLRAFVEVLDDSARIHGQAVKKVVAEAALNVDNGPHYMNKTQESKPINQTPPGPVTDLLLPPEDPTEATLEKNLEIEELEQVTAILDRDLPPPEPLIAPTQKPDSSDISDTNTPQEQIPKEPEVVQQAMDEKGSELVQHMEKEKDSKEDKDKDNEKEKEKEKEREEKEKDKGKEKDKDKEKNKERTIGHKPPLKHKAPLSSGKNGKLRSNSPKPAKTSKLVTEEATELSLSLEEAKRIAGMRILLAEDNLIAQKVLSKQLELFGLVISCANDGADALTLFKSHPRGYYTLGFFDHHMPNCDGVQATQQIRALEREHAVEVKGPVPRLPLVAVSADIQGTAKEACLNSGMERYVTKPLMQKDLVAIVRHFCVLGDAEASTLAFTPPPEIVKVPSHTTNSLTVPSTVEAMVSAGHVSASIGVNCGLPPMLLSVTSAPTTSVLAGSDKIPAQKLLPKRDLDLSPAALRGLQLIRETTLQDESSKVGGGGNMKSMNLALPIVSSSPMGSSAMALSGVAGETIITSLLPPMPGSHPMQHSNSHYRLSTTHAMTSPTLRGAQIGPLNKANSSPSLSSSYQAGVTSSPIAAPPSVAQPTTVSMATSQGSTTAAPSGSSLLLPTSSTSHLSGPIAAMAAGAAAAAVAVATATVKSVSSAIQDHIPQPSIYAAQGSSVISSNNNLCSWSSLLGNGPSIHQTQQQPQLQHVQQCQDQSLVLQPPYDLHQQQVLPLQPQPQLIYHPAQEVFVPYLHPVEPSVAKEQDSPPMVPGNDGMIGKSSPVTITVTVPDSVPEPLISSTGVSGTLDSTTTGAGTKLPSAPIQLKTWL